VPASANKHSDPKGALEACTCLAVDLSSVNGQNRSQDGDEWRGRLDKEFVTSVSDAGGPLSRLIARDAAEKERKAEILSRHWTRQ
jgi:hypothetical protein